jgi:hypothetical protein
MNKIKLGRRTWVDAKGRKQKAFTFTYKDQGKKKVIQSPNKNWLEQEAEKILLRIGNINPKNMNVVISVPLSYAWKFILKNVNQEPMNQLQVLAKLHLKNTQNITNILKSIVVM